MRKARYYDRYVEEAARALSESPLSITVGNNRTAVELVVPFSGELTVEQLLDVVKTRLGISLDRANFPDLGTSCGPSLSLTVDRVAQPFSKKLSELSAEEIGKLQLWIRLIWRDELETKGDHYDATKFALLLPDILMRRVTGADALTEDERGRLTLGRMEALIQANIWQSLDQSDPLTAPER